MRTIQQQLMEARMFADLKEIIARSRATVLEDALGVVSLFVLLFAGLSLSGAA